VMVMAGVLAIHPHQMLAYNLSPSFNWDAAGMNDAQMQSYIPDLANMGYCWQFITLAGFHSNALVVDTFARDFAQRGMLAYVQDIQRQERTHGVETLSHQTWSGANYYDQLLKTVTGGVSSTAAMGKGKGRPFDFVDVLFFDLFPILFCNFYKQSNCRWLCTMILRMGT
jgi:isocitrate lyase